MSPGESLTVKGAVSALVVVKWENNIIINTPALEVHKCIAQPPQANSPVYLTRVKAHPSSSLIPLTSAYCWLRASSLTPQQSPGANIKVDSAGVGVHQLHVCEGFREVNPSCNGVSNGGTLGTVASCWSQVQAGRW